MSLRISPVFLLIIAATLPSVSAYAEVTLPKVFGDHMVLQRDQLIPVWGIASPGEAVSLTLGDETITVVADADGKWFAKFDPRPASAASVSLTVVGTIWLCTRSPL